jgi:DNA mismatch repair protein MutS
VKLNVRKKKNRSGKALCDICQEPHILEIHHIRGRKIPNANDDFNLVDICANCHNKIHYGKIIIENWVMTSNGKKLIYREPHEESFTGNDAIPHQVLKR